MSLMSIPCPECDSIRLEFAEAWRSLRGRLSGRRPAPNQIAAWLEQLDETQCRETRETSSLWRVWRRQREHRILTGHYAPAVIGPGNSANRN